ADREALLLWFDDRGVAGPRREYEDGLATRRQGEEDERKWVAAMPASLRPLWPDMRRRQLDPDLPPLRAALADEFPEPRARLLAHSMASPDQDKRRRAERAFGAR